MKFSNQFAKTNKCAETFLLLFMWLTCNTACCQSVVHSAGLGHRRSETWVRGMHPLRQTPRYLYVYLTVDTFIVYSIRCSNNETTNPVFTTVPGVVVRMNKTFVRITIHLGVHWRPLRSQQKTDSAKLKCKCIRKGYRDPTTSSSIVHAFTMQNTF